MTLSMTMTGILLIIVLCISSAHYYTLNEESSVIVSTAQNITVEAEEFVVIEEQIATEYPAEWTCFDFAIWYSEENPEYGMFVISDNARFNGMNHIVNYIVEEDNVLSVVSYVKEGPKYIVTYYELGGWEYDHCTFEYRHFYMDGEIPTRTYMEMKPNAEEFYKTL